VPLWPAEVWEGQIDVILFALLLLFQTTRPKKGQPCCLYVMLYSLLRFFLEFLRGDYVEPMLWGHCPGVLLHSPAPLCVGGDEKKNGSLTGSRFLFHFFRL